MNPSAQGPGPSRDDDEFSPYETDWNQEFVAGWLDGHRSSKIVILNLTRVELRRFGLLVGDEGYVREGQPDELHGDHLVDPPKPDNPDHRRAYHEGWEAGSEAGQRAILLTLRQELLARNLFVTDSGSVTTMDVASELVDYCRELADLHQMATVTDDEIHAFIDGRPALEPAPSAATSSPKPAERLGPSADLLQDKGLWSQLLHWFAGVLTMIRKEVDRRTILVAMSGMMVTATVGWWMLGETPGPAAVRLQQGAPSSGYVPPTIWDNLPAAAKAQYLAWDQIAWQYEQNGGQSTLQNLIASIMSTPGNDQLKSNLAHFIRTSGRIQELYPLLHGMDPAITAGSARRSIMHCVYTLHENGLLDPIPADLGVGLVTYQQSGLETDPGAQVLLAHLVQDFQDQN